MHEMDNQPLLLPTQNTLHRPPESNLAPNHRELLLRLYTKTQTRFFYYLDYTIHTITPSSPITNYGLWIVLGTLFNIPATSLRNFFNHSYTFSDTSFERASDIAQELQSAIARACITIPSLQLNMESNLAISQQCQASLNPNNYSLHNTSYDNSFQKTLNYVQHGTNTIWYAAIVFFTLSAVI